MKKKDLTGLQYHDLTIIKPGKGKFTGKKNPKKRTTWICKCVCGKEVEVLTSNLKDYGGKPRTQSCGCRVQRTIKYNFTNLTGKTFGFLTVIKKCDEKIKTRGALWLCECKCGHRFKLSSNSLTSGNNVTCTKKILSK